jgi:hypothetical protein
VVNQFLAGGLHLAPQTIERFKVRMARLYEQGADAIRIGQYVRRWWRWVNAGVVLTDLTGLRPVGNTGAGWTFVKSWMDPPTHPLSSTIEQPRREQRSCNEDRIGSRENAIGKLVTHTHAPASTTVPCL